MVTDGVESRGRGDGVGRVSGNSPDLAGGGSGGGGGGRQSRRQSPDSDFDSCDGSVDLVTASAGGSGAAPAAIVAPSSGLSLSSVSRHQTTSTAAPADFYKQDTSGNVSQDYYTRVSLLGPSLNIN